MNAAASVEKDTSESTENAQLALQTLITLKDLTPAFANKDSISSDNKSKKIPTSPRIPPAHTPATPDTFIQHTDPLMGQDKPDQSNNLVTMIDNLFQSMLDQTKEIF
jgi:hypothetical protein